MRKGKKRQRSILNLDLKIKEDRVVKRKYAQDSLHLISPQGPYIIQGPVYRVFWSWQASAHICTCRSRQIDLLCNFPLKCQAPLWANSLNLSLICVCACVCVNYRDSSRGCCTVRRRGWRSLVSCCTPLLSESMIWSFSNFWYLSTIFLSNTNTATSWRVKDKQQGAER